MEIMAIGKTIQTQNCKPLTDQAKELTFKGRNLQGSDKKDRVWREWNNQGTFCPEFY